MIRKGHGNLLNTDAEALVNTVNTVGVMGRGIALQFKKAFPENYKAYRRVCERGELEPGKMFTFDLNRFHNPKYVINFPTKKHWRGKSRIEFIESGLQALAREIRRLRIKSIAIPPLGAGLGGLDWQDVYSRITSVLGNLSDVDIIVFEPRGAPDPASMPDRTKRPNMTPTRAALLGLATAYLKPLMDDSITLLELHKLMYFMQEAGEPMRLKFVKGFYGPYATNLHHVLDRIEGHFIIGYGEGSEKPGKEIQLKREAVLEAEEFLAKKPQTRTRFARLENLIEGFETPYGMELLASVHWVAAKEGSEQACKSSDKTIEEVHAWNPRKRKMFLPGHIWKAWQRLHQLDWL